MRAKDLRIVFMGTPDLAAHILHETFRAGYHVVAVVTAPDRPAGRGRKLKGSPVKEVASELGIPVLQPEKLKSPAFIEALKALKPDIQLVVAFRMLPEAVWSLPTLGTFNLHASLLPDYRGAAPINWVIINGEKESGVTTFLIDQQIDTGNILFREPIELDTWETAGSLHEKVKKAGAPLCMKTIDALATGKAKPIEQGKLIGPDQELEKAPKLYKEDCRIDWRRPCLSVVNHIHGLSPLPGAFFELESGSGEKIVLKLYSARPISSETVHQPGTIVTDDKSFLHIACPDGYVDVLTLQMAGKKRMSTQELLRGTSLADFKQVIKSPPNH